MNGIRSAKCDESLDHERWTCESGGAGPRTLHRFLAVRASARRVASLRTRTLRTPPRERAASREVVGGQDELVGAHREVLGGRGERGRSGRRARRGFDERVGGFDECVGGFDECVGGLDECVGGLDVWADPTDEGVGRRKSRVGSTGERVLRRWLHVGSTESSLPTLATLVGGLSERIGGSGLIRRDNRRARRFHRYASGVRQRGSFGAQPARW